MKNNRAKAIADGAICSALSALLMVIYIYVSPLAFLMILVSGAPMAYLAIKHGLRICIPAMFVSIFALFVLTGDIISALLVGIINLLPGVAVGRALSKRASFSVVVLLGSVAVLIGFMVQLVLFNTAGGGEGIKNLIEGSIESARKIAEPVIASLAEQNAEQSMTIYSMWNKAMEQVQNRIFTYMPSFLIGASGVMGYLIYMSYVFILSRVKRMRVPYLPFKWIRANRMTCDILIIVYIITLFSDSSSVWMLAFKNMAALLNAYLAVCGLALIDFKLGKKIKSGYARSGIYVVFFFVSYMFIGFIYQILSIVGMIDSLMDFRRMHGAGDNRD